jgi:Fe-S-cluster containining protein
MYLKAGLGVVEAGRVCMRECQAGCCRGAMYLRLSPAEAALFRQQADMLGLSIHLEQSPDGGGTVGFLEHEGERCPMLEEATGACRIYERRPARCRDFPERPRPGCAISGG